MTSATDLKVRQLGVRVGGQLLIDGLNLDVGPGRFVGLLGPNGSGKSSLLKAIYRVLRPERGTVCVGGVPATSMTAKVFARTLAVVAQEAPGGVNLSVADMVLLGRIPHQRALSGTSTADRAAATAALATVGAGELADRAWPTLSGGEKQRVLLARALAQDGQVLVLDEPTNHLDVRHQFGLLHLVRRLGVTTLAALHDLNLAAEFCDEVVVLQAGAIVAAGPPADVLVDDVVHPVFGVHVDQVRHPRTGALRLLLSESDATQRTEPPPSLAPSSLNPGGLRMIRTRSAATLIAAALALTGCTSHGSDSPDAAAGLNRSAERSATTITDLPPVTEDFNWPPAETPPGHYPVTVSSCGEPVTFDKAPERAVVNDDNMIELMFALGLTDRMAGYAGAGQRLRLAAFTDDYAAVKSLGPDYFTLEPLLGRAPDFVFAGWNYGFDAAGINPDNLAELGIPSYVLSESCRRIDDILAPATIDEWFGDVRVIAAIFGVPERAEALIAHWRGRLDRVADRLPDDAEPVPVFCWDWGTDSLGTGAGLTIVPELYRHAGAVNIFTDLNEMWEDVSFEDFVDRAPELIAVTDYGDGPTGQQKIEMLKAMDGIDTVPAVRNNRFLVLPQEAVNPGIRIVDGIEALAAELYPQQFADLADKPGFGLAPTAS